jgi:hypothetical protein
MAADGVMRVSRKALGDLDGLLEAALKRRDWAKLIASQAKKRFVYNGARAANLRDSPA